jgi:hypothetical protein
MRKDGAMDTTWKDWLLGTAMAGAVYLVLTRFVLRDFPGSRGPYLALFVSLLSAQMYRLDRRFERLQRRLGKSDGA